MRNICKYAFIGVLLTVALGYVWADDYVDDVYYSPQPRGKRVEQPASENTHQTPLKGEVRNEETGVSSETKEDGKITIEYLPQTADTVVVIRVKK